MDGKVGTVIFGATFYGMTLAKILGDEALLVERGYRIGEEFAASLRVNRFSGNVKSEYGRMFLDAMKKNNLIDDEGNIYSVPSAYLLADMCTDIKAMFATEVLSVEETNDGYRIELFNCNGRHIVFADRIVDTTAEGAVKAGIFAKKTLNVILSEPLEDTEYDSFTNGHILCIETELNETLPDVRSRLYDLFEREHTGVVFVTDMFDYKMEKPIHKQHGNYHIIPSVAFGNLISAVDGGGQGYEF